MQEQEVLNLAVKNGMIDLQYLQSELIMREQKKYLDQHPYSIWQGKNDNKFYTYLPSENKSNGRCLVKRKTKEEINQIVIDYWKNKENNPTLQELFDIWNDHRLELKKISNSTHMRNVALFNRHYCDIKYKHVKDVNSEFLLDFLESQIPKYSLTAKSFSNLKTLTKGMFKKARRMKLVDFHIEDVFLELDVQDKEFSKTIKEDYQEVFDEEETDKIMEYLLTNMDLYNLGIVLLFVTGIRVGELVVLQHSDFTDDGRVLKIRKTETRYKEKDSHTCIYEVKNFPKTDAGIRDVIIPDDYLWVVKRLKIMNPFGEYIFMRNGKRTTTNSFRKRLKDVCKKLNIPHKTPHKIRKTYGSILIDNNIDTRLITDMMGHTDITCTERHYHRNRKSIERKAEILSRIPDFQLKSTK